MILGESIQFLTNKYDGSGIIIDAFYQVGEVYFIAHLLTTPIRKRK